MEAGFMSKAGSGRLISVKAVSIGEQTSGHKYPEGDSYARHLLCTVSTFTLEQDGGV